MTLRFGSLFSGIGGMDLGLERAGMECVWQVEKDEFCRRVLAKHWPKVRRFMDVTRIDWDSIKRPDLICGGPPCQPFSSASRGRKRGTEDARWLWPPMFAAIEMLRPDWVLVENVTQFDGPGLEQVVSDLEASDYEVSPPLEVPACAFGHDHRRARLWVLGHTDSDGESVMPLDAEVARVPRGDRDAEGVGAADGLPGRLDRHRLTALGNAVVPDVAEFIGRRIMEASA